MRYDYRKILSASRHLLAKTKSACGANAEGGGGFRIGNTCAEGAGDSESGTQKQSQVATESLANEWYAKRQVPDGWYVHGRADRDDLNTGNVIQMTKDWGVTEQYAGKRGSMWMIRASDNATVLDFNDDEITRKIAEKLIKEHENGVMSYAGLESTIGYFIDANGSDDDAIEKLAEELNPVDIVNSAGFFDDQDFPKWLWDNYEPAMAITADGAVVIDVTQIEKAKVTERSGD